jgi:hypothetical protein
VITQAIVHAALGIATWFCTLFPAWDPPAWFVSLGSSLAGLVSGMSGLGGWIDWPIVSVIAAAAIGTWLVCLGIKALRAIASYIPFVGGAG